MGQNNTVNKEIIAKIVNRVFTELFELPPEELTQEKHIFQDLGLDSLDIVDMIVALQKQFGITLRQDERFKKVRTLGDIYNLFEVLFQENKINIDNIPSQKV